MMNRRQALATTLLSGAALSLIAQNRAPAAEPTPIAPTGPFSVPPLGYAYDALEPFIDAETMQLHHDKHHTAYVTKLNEALASADAKSLAGKSIEELLTSLPSMPEALQKAIRNQGGGHYNHTLFWQMLKKTGGAPSEALTTAIQASFGSMEEFWKKFAEAATKQFGSGWAWLVVGSDKKLAVVSTPNQNSPISEGQTELLGLDVWEHAYYLKYRNKRPDYIAAFPKIVNWDFVNSRFAKATA
ncbi:MAG: superoxide dismutase [Chthoniobacterales bacterium]